MSRPRALFVCDGSPVVGGGHVMRSLTLAAALAERGWRSTFLADGFVARVLDRHDRSACDRLPVADCRPETLAKAAASTSGFDAAVFDHFGINARHELAGSDAIRVAVDDLADRPHAVDVLVDCNIQRRPAHYTTVAPNAELLLGPSFAPVRPEFAAVREAALQRRRETPGSAGRVLVSLGLTDFGGITERVVRHILPWNRESGLDVVIGSGAASRDPLRRLEAEGAALTVHEDVDAAGMARLMSAADLAVGAGGSATWERATIGLSTVTLILADNQAPGALALETAHATVAIDARTDAFLQPMDASEGAMSRFLWELSYHAIDDFKTLLGERAAELCDGLGAGRVADQINARL